MRLPAVNAVSCLNTNCCFLVAVPLSLSSKKLILQRTTAGGRTLSTNSLTLFEVILSMMVLSAAQVLPQSSAGTAVRAAVKGASAASSGRGSGGGSLALSAGVVRAFFLCSAGCVLPLKLWDSPPGYVLRMDMSSFRAFASLCCFSLAFPPDILKCASGDATAVPQCLL